MDFVSLARRWRFSKLWSQKMFDNKLSLFGIEFNVKVNENVIHSNRSIMFKLMIQPSGKPGCISPHFFTHHFLINCFPLFSYFLSLVHASSFFLSIFISILLCMTNFFSKHNRIQKIQWKQKKKKILKGLRMSQDLECHNVWFICNFFVVAKYRH